LITDYEMPGENGFALADDFHTHYPRVPVILVTAHRTQSLDAQVLDRPFPAGGEARRLCGAPRLDSQCLRIPACGACFYADRELSV
jgi:CheY-like chemotaxis protein